MEYYVQLAFLVILIEMISCIIITKKSRQSEVKLPILLIMPDLYVLCAFSLYCNGKTHVTNCMMVTVEMPVTAGEGSVYLPVNAMPF